MKLIYRIIYRISLAMVLILAVWAVLFYFAIMGVVNDEVDDQLDDYSEQIMIKALSGEELPAVSNSRAQRPTAAHEESPGSPGQG